MVQVLEVPESLHLLLLRLPQNVPVTVTLWPTWTCWVDTCNGSAPAACAATGTSVHATKNEVNASRVVRMARP